MSGNKIGWIIDNPYKSQSFLEINNGSYITIATVSVSRQDGNSDSSLLSWLFSRTSLKKTDLFPSVCLCTSLKLNILKGLGNTIRLNTVISVLFIVGNDQATKKQCFIS